MSEDLQALFAALASDDAQEREAAAQQLAELKEDAAAPYLQHALEDEAEGVRMWGAYGLSLLMRPQDTDVLARAAADEASPLVRLWATFGLAAQKDAAGAKALVEFLDSDDAEVRTNAADALTSLDDASQVRPALEARMKSKQPRAQAWAAGVLHALEHPTAFSAWQQALLNPDGRVDAALVAPFLQSQSAARALLRLLGELPTEELDSSVSEEGQDPLAELLSRPLPELGLESLIDEAQEDETVRAELLLVLIKGPPADPDVLSDIHEFAAELLPAQLGRDIAELLAEQDPEDHADMIARVATAVPDAVEATVAAMPAAARKAVFDTVASVMRKGEDRAFELLPLLDTLRTTRFADQFEDVPDPIGLAEPDQDLTAPGVPTVGDEDGEGDSDDDFQLEDLSAEQLAELESSGDEGLEQSFGDLGGDAESELEGSGDELTLLIERIVAGDELTSEEQAKAKAFLDELGMTAEEYVAQIHAEPGDDEAPPPTAMEVAQRALALGALLRRSELERKLADGEVQRPEAARNVQAIKKWLDEKMLLEILSPMEADLLDARTGDWTVDDREFVHTSADALAMLLWALGKTKALSAEEPAPAAALVKSLPILQDPRQFVDNATIKDHEEISRLSDLWETWAFRVQQEDQARAVLEDPETELPLDVDALIAELKTEGFDDRAASAKGKGNRAAEAMRFLGRKAAQRLVDEKIITKLTAGDLGLKGKPVSQLDGPTLDALRALVNERARALSWITVGGSWEAVDEGFEDFGDEAG